MTEITSQVKAKCIAICDAIPVKLCPVLFFSMVCITHILKFATSDSFRGDGSHMKFHLELLSLTLSDLERSIEVTGF